MKISELLLYQNLADFRLCYGYHVELKHGLFGYFPALISDNQFVCIDKLAIEHVLRLLPSRSFQLNRLLLLVNEKEKFAFCIRSLQDSIAFDRESLSIIELPDLKSKQLDIKWAPGLVSSTMPDEKYIELIKESLEQDGTRCLMHL